MEESYIGKFITINTLFGTFVDENKLIGKFITINTLFETFVDENKLIGKLQTPDQHILSGIISKDAYLTGRLNITTGYDTYQGPYEVAPHAFEEQTLKTANMGMKENVVVLEVPYFEVSNDTGTTVYIAKEV